MMPFHLSPAQLDSRSFFFDIAPGAQSAASGFVTLLAAAHALRNITQEAPPNRTILYAFFQGVRLLSFTFMVFFVCLFVLYLKLTLFFFTRRKPLTTSAVPEWCTTWRTGSFLWTWTTFTLCWRSDRCV